MYFSVGLGLWEDCYAVFTGVSGQEEGEWYFCEEFIITWSLLCSGTK